MKSVFKNYFKYIAFGILGASAFPPFYIFFTFLLTWGWLFAQSYLEKSGRTFLIGSFLFFSFFYLTNLYWLALPLTIDFESHGFLIPVALLLIPIYISIFHMPAAIFVRIFAEKNQFEKIYRGAAIFSALLSIGIYFYGHWCPGFPWILPGYVWSVHEIFLQTLSFWGIYGLSFATLLMSCFLGISFVYWQQKDIAKSKIAAILGSTFLIILAFFGWWRLESYPTSFTDRSIRVVQCNFLRQDSNDTKFALQNIKNHIQNSRGTKADFIIWPEAAVKYLYHENDANLNSWLRSPLVGDKWEEENNKVFNGLVVIDFFGKCVEYYNKIRLVAFGEYIPFRKYLPFKNITNAIGDFDAGTERKILEIKNVKIAPMICYEAVFPIECVRDSLWSFSGEKSEFDVMLNLTNDEWFGFSSEPFQHFQIVRARAIEMGVPLIRSTNFGMSAVFDPCGRIIAKIPFDEKGVIDCNTPKKLDRGTFYDRHGDLIFYFLVILALIF